MRFLTLKLTNYIGIYNGMGLNEIFIDFTKCLHKTIIIRGMNGSGKSTLFKALNVLPDPNDQFIPGMPASKEVGIFDNGISYYITCIHGIKNNGDREVTKVYFKKCTDGVNYIELNPSGNVTAYKDLLYEELSLDANFIALSQLSSEEKGLASKKPAERKRFVNSIISSLEVYNGIYKTLSKKSSMYKTMINSVSTKLAQLGDPELTKKNLEDYSNRSAQVTLKRDQLLETLGSLKSQLALLDPDGSIQESYKQALSDLKIAEHDIKAVDQSIKAQYEKHELDMMGDSVLALHKVQQQITNIQMDTQILKTSLTSILADREAESKVLMNKQQRLSSFDNVNAFQEVSDEIASLRAENESIKGKFIMIGVNDISNLTKDEYIIALNTLTSLKDQVKSFSSEFDNDIIEESWNKFTNAESLPDTSVLVRRKEEAETNLDSLNKEYDKISERVKTLEKLSLRPTNCNNDECPFIKEAVENSKGNYPQVLDNLSIQISNLKEESYTLNIQIERMIKISNCMNRIRSTVRDIEVHSSILRKMPNGELYSNPMEFFYRLMRGDIFEEISTLNAFIDYSNMIDIYNHNNAVINQLEADLKVYKNQQDAIDELVSEIEALNFKIKGLEDRVVETNQKIESNDTLRIMLSKQETAYITINELKDQKKEIENRFIEATSKVKTLEDSMEAIKIQLEQLKTISSQLTECDQTIASINREKEKYSRSLDLMKEYTEEFQSLSKDYDFVEKIKYYSSPTTGIQLVFMELYMGKIIALANELLSLLFSGEYVLQPFIINESEFRIPCLGSGYINDDISSMSSAQISMISMIISFSLLYHSSSRFNIMKLDEIDGPLDSENRIMFINVLNKIMEIMNVEQCILISHNSELQSMYSDVILLKLSDEMKNEYSDGNIIWRYQ